MTTVSKLKEADKVQWIVGHYLAFSLRLRELENMYDGVAIRHPKFIFSSFTLSFLTSQSSCRILSACAHFCLEHMPRTNTLNLD